MADAYKSRRTSKDLVGETRGLLTAVELILKEPGVRNRCFLRCECACGNQVTRRADGFKSGRFLSCGCNKRSKVQPTGPNSPSFQGYGVISKTHYSRIKRGAERRGIPFDISIEFCAELFDSQHARCAMTGLPLTFGRLQHHHETTASLDRIDSLQGYTPTNCQWVHKDINTMKSIFSKDYFTEMCRLVTMEDRKRKPQPRQQ